MCRSQSGFHNFLRTLFALILTRKKGLLIRATAVGENSRSSLFYGRRHIHKTVISRILPKADILTDGFVAVKPHNSHLRVYSTPFQGVCRSTILPVRAKLDNIYFLKKDHNDSFAPVRGSAPLLALFRNSAFFTNDSLLLNSLWDNCRQIIKTIPSYEAHICPRKPSIESEAELSLAALLSQTAFESGFTEGIGIRK